MFVIEADWLVLPGGRLERGPVCVAVEGERITAVFKQNSAAASDHTQLHTHLLTAGFIDLHTHGIGGSDDVTEFWLNPGYSQRIFPSRGTTSFLATTIFPQDYPQTPAILSTLGKHVGQLGHGAVLEGIHAEGPIVQELGGLPPSDTAMPLDRFKELLDSIPDLRMMTISPHLEAAGGYQRIRALLNRGILPSLGHDRAASEEEVLGALSLSPSRRLHITHLFNVCTFHHRAPSLVNFGLANTFPKLPKYEGLSPPTVELIGDLAHVHPMVLSTVLKARSFHDICFVTDSVMEPKPGAIIRYRNRQMQVSEDGRTLSLVGQGTLAGSCCSMVDVLHNLVRVLEVPLGEAVAMLSENPARIVGLSHIGTVEEGKRADLLLFDKEMNLQQTIVAGRTEHQKKHH